MDDANAIGDYLRARRELVRPEDVGIRVGGVRRVPGLRREEVAMLSGISSDYYLRLEQGRDRNPSVQVLEALARVLQLDGAATQYLIGLAQPQPHRSPRPRREVVPEGIRQLLRTIGQPAFVEGRYLDVLASNDLAVAISPRLAVGGNRLLDVFLDEDERELFPEWERAVAVLLAGFRASVGTDTDDPRFIQLVGQLSLKSEMFRKLWARHDVSVRVGGSVVLRHPQVGDLALRREKLAITGAEGQRLVIYHAERGSVTDGLLGILASAAATDSVAAATTDSATAAASRGTRTRTGAAS